MNEIITKPVVVILKLDNEIIGALDRGRTDERLSRRSYARSIVARHLREAGLLASSATIEASR